MFLNGTQVESNGVNTTKPAVVIGAISPFWRVMHDSASTHCGFKPNKGRLMIGGQASTTRFERTFSNSNVHIRVILSFFFSPLMFVGMLLFVGCTVRPDVRTHGNFSLFGSLLLF